MSHYIINPSKSIALRWWYTQEDDFRSGVAVALHTLISEQSTQEPRFMDIGLYRRYLQQYVQEALDQSNGTIAGIAENLHAMNVSGLLVIHKDEKKRALADARKAFDEHRHWPLDIILSHLGVEVKNKP